MDDLPLVDPEWEATLQAYLRHATPAPRPGPQRCSWCGEVQPIGHSLGCRVWSAPDRGAAGADSGAESGGAR